MELHPQAQAVLEHIASFGFPPITEVSPPKAREIRRAHVRPSAIELHEIRDVDAGGVPARLYRPSSDDGLGLLVYFHGGGWVVGRSRDARLDVSRPCGRERSRGARRRLPAALPSIPSRLALDDAMAATRWASAHAEELGCAPGQLAIGGDSAGGNLAAAVTQQGAVPLSASSCSSTR